MSGSERGRRRPTAATPHGAYALLYSRRRSPPSPRACSRPRSARTPVRATPPSWSQTLDARSWPSDPPRCAHRRSRTESGHPTRRTGHARLPSITSGPQGGWHGVRRYGIYKTRSPGKPVSQYGVLAGLRAKLGYGLFGTKEEPASVPASRATQYPRFILQGARRRRACGTWLSIFHRISPLFDRRVHPRLRPHSSLGFGRTTPDRHGPK